MDQDLSRGQLYYDEDDIDLNKDTQPSSGQTHLLWHYENIDNNKWDS